MTLFVFAGPPCSGKTTIAAVFAQKWRIEHLQMDEFRRRLIPDSDHRRRDIDVAYRAMHLAAELFLRRGEGVIVESTYGRYEQRRELETVAAETESPLYLIQCRVPPAVAVERFERRSTDHPAVDLTPTRVAELAAVYPYAPVGLTLDATAELATQVKVVVEYQFESEPVTPGEWARAVRNGGSWPGPRTEP